MPAQIRGRRGLRRLGRIPPSFGNAEMKTCASCCQSRQRIEWGTPGLHFSHVFLARFGSPLTPAGFARGLPVPHA